jgi:3-deoxy-D-manno-octulosonate 8-phosphate phosphatase (KDO 8-P phosphatase)
MVDVVEIKLRAARVKLLLMDCDGVLTDGRIELLENGDETKTFHTRDGHGIVLMHRAGLSTGIISGRTSSFVERRAGELGITHLRQGTWDKVKDYEEILAESGVTEAEVAFIGDDVTDVPLMQRSGFAVAVADAVSEARANAHYITQIAGGFGAVREVCELILKSQGNWDDLMKRYVKSKEEGERRKAEG